MEKESNLLAQPGGKPAPDSPRTSGSIPRTVWVLGFVSLLMDVSSEMIHAVLPLFMVQVLAADMMTVGFTEGAAEGIALATKVFSGYIADRFGRKKRLVLLGYGLGVATKPVFAIADAMSTVFAARMLDRIGKGLRGAPRDALVAEATPPEMLGAAYGLRQSLDAAGAFAGPLIAAFLLWQLTEDAFKTIFWLAFIPGLLCIALILLGVKESGEKSAAKRAPLHLKPLLARIFSDPSTKPFRTLLLFALLVSFARFSTAFIALRASDAGLANAWIPLVLAGMNLVFSLSSYPLARLCDRTNPKGLLVAGLIILALSQTALACAGSTLLLLAGIALWGLHLGAMQGVLSAMVARTSAPEWRASAFGLFNLVSGAGMLAAGALAGMLWDLSGPAATFGFGAAAALAAALLFEFFGAGLGSSKTR